MTKKRIKALTNKFEKYKIDGYVIPKNDEFFSEYSQKDRLKTISNFTGSAGYSIILKNKNYLFVDGRYTIQAEKESGNFFKIVDYHKIVNCDLFKNLTLGIDPKVFTSEQIKNFFIKYNDIKIIKSNLIDQIYQNKSNSIKPFFSLKDNVVGESFKKKIIKIKKKINKIKSPKASLKSAKVTSKNMESKADNLRISKNNEVKPEIKKVKKQETEKREYKIKDFVVYPKHGVGQITEFKKISIGGIDVETYVIKFDKDKANGMVPVNKQSHLRPLATINQVNKCISILKSKPKIKRSMWSRRAQEYEAKISSGKIYELAEVVRDLNKGDDLMVDQSYSERQLFEKAYERILSEFQIILNTSPEDTQKKLDKALKRNLEGQSKNVVPQQTKTQTSDLRDEETVADTEDPIEE